MHKPVWALVVEGPGGGADALARTLAELGYTATRAESWRRALEDAERSPMPPELVVTPLNLGGETDGLRLHRVIAGRTPGVASLVLFRPEDVDTLPDAPLPPGVRLLKEPCDPRQLRSAAEAALGEARSPPEGPRPSGPGPSRG